MPKKGSKVRSNGNGKPQGYPLRQVGSRWVVLRPDETVLGEDGDWRISKVEEWSKDGWSSLKVFHDKIGARKNVYTFGVRYGSFARNRDAKLLFEKFPEVMMWVLKVVGSRRVASGAAGKAAGEGYGVGG